ncbi:MAG: ACP S-malonyltransferase [Alphaproteobacteria bacterium]|nr:ACP S-malonyltransferase [Alphaproteobacteria bacterium]
MKTQALVFPGQGSQKIGMGRDLYDNFAVAKEVFAEVDDALGCKLTDIMFDGQQEELNLTNNAQPAILAVSMAYFEVFKSTGLIDEQNIKFAAGHSLGEYSALCAAGALSLAEAARLLKLRGEYMMSACRKEKGAMAAIIGWDLAKVRVLAEALGCYVANSNSPAQIVISGSEENITRAVEQAAAEGAKRAIRLSVSGAFHSPLMQSAAEAMGKVLPKAKIAEPKFKVISNVTAKEYADTNEIKHLLEEQITSTVKWQESVGYMKECNVDEFVEVGFGNVLSGLIKKTVPDAAVLTSNDLLNQL